MIRNFVAVAMMLILTSCTGQLVSHQLSQGDLRAPGTGTEYHLLRQDFIVRSSWALISCPEENSRADPKIALRTTVVPKRRADLRETYWINQEELAKGSKKISLSLSYYDVQELGGPVIKSINATAEDQSSAAIQSSLEIAARVAGAFFGIPSIEVQPEDAQQARPMPRCTPSAIQQLARKNAVLADIKASNQILEIIETQIQFYQKQVNLPDVDPELKIEELLRKRDEIRDKRKADQRSLQIMENFLSSEHKVELFELDWSDECDGIKQEGFCRKKTIDLDEKKIEDWFFDVESVEKSDTKAEILFVFMESPQHQPELTVVPSKQIEKTTIVEGVIMRTPLDGDLFICRNECTKDTEELLSEVKKYELAKEQITDVKALKNRLEQLSYKGRFGIPQAGRPNLIRLENGPFQENSIKISRDGEGRIVEYTYGDNAAIVGGLASANASVGTIIDSVTSIKDRELTKDKLKKEKLQTKKDILELEAAIDKLESDSDASSTE